MDTLQEINSDFFTVERSANGTNYEIAMVMQGKGYSAEPLNYEFTDSSRCREPVITGS